MDISNDSLLLAAAHDAGLSKRKPGLQSTNTDGDSEDVSVIDRAVKGEILKGFSGFGQGRNRDRSAAVGIRHVSFFPKIAYR
jgi:hypothetical protein